jgi:hypothetical protein
MIVHRVPFQQSYPLLIAQISQYLAYRRSHFPEDYLPTVFRDEYDVILALPSYMRQTFKIVHTLFLLPSRAFPWRESVSQPTARRNGLACQGRTAIGRGFSWY